MKNSVIYIHGKGGSAAESEHYKPLFPGCDVIGLDYKTFTPWETGKEIHAAVGELKNKYDQIILISNSIGAFFSMNADIDGLIQRAYFISPVIDMEKLIADMMTWANVTEEELQRQGVIPTDFGENLSWDYLCYVRDHPVEWNVPTDILYGSRDELTSYDTISTFAEKHNADLTVMENGEHWFRTEEQMRFLDDWIKSGSVYGYGGVPNEKKTESGTIRFAEYEDLESVNILRKQVNDLHVIGKPEVFKEGFSEELRDYIYSIFDDPLKKIVVYEIDGVVRSFAVLNHITKPETPFMYVRDYLDIDEFCVDETFRRKGLATEMIDFIRIYAGNEGFDRIELNMWEFNKGALEFYESAGFTTYRRYMEMKL